MSLLVARRSPRSRPISSSVTSYSFAWSWRSCSIRRPASLRRFAASSLADIRHRQHRVQFPALAGLVLFQHGEIIFGAHPLAFGVHAHEAPRAFVVVLPRQDVEPLLRWSGLRPRLRWLGLLNLSTSSPRLHLCPPY